ncbi:MAG TPA: DMT family transporter [Acidobacteriaceae bacterium]|jgi:drug/metabolite transporter (DMT)-like permease|nr:DMT family transporter [Acidobacteriaceae bacterium]
MTFRRYLVLVAVTLTAAFGDTFLARGMKSLPPVSLAHPVGLIHAIFSPWVAIGIVVLIGFFATYLTALSFADLTYVLPATSMGYVIMTILAHFWLHERVSPWRWLGVLCITAGVGFVTQGPSWTHNPPAQPRGVSEALAEPPPQEVER